MKKLFLPLVLTFFYYAPVFAQTYKIDTANVGYENKLRPCLHVAYDAEPKTVKKALSSFLKKNYKVKIKGIGFLADKDIVYAEDITMHNISDKRMNLYARVTDMAGGSEMSYFMSFGYDFFIGPENYPKEFDAMKTFLNDFSLKFLNEYYSDETSGILKKIKRYEKDIRKNDRAIKSNTKKSRKASSAEASGLEAKNNSINFETKQLHEKIEMLKQELENIKTKQAGITRS